MKTTLILITLISALSTFPVLAADNEDAALSIEARLTQVDLSVTLKQYEKVKLLVQDAELQLALGGGSDTEREALRKRIAILRDETTKLREVARHYDAEVRKIRAVASAGKRN